MPIGLDEAQNHHPLELTREASPEVPMTEGDFTLEQLRDMFGKPEMPEEEVLAAAGDAGMAFFKVGDVYKSFAPLKGDAVELVVSPSESSGVSVDDADGLLNDDEEDEDGDEDYAQTMAEIEDLPEDEIPGYADMMADPDDEEDAIGDNTDDEIAVVSVNVTDDDEEDDGTADPITF